MTLVSLILVLILIFLVLSALNLLLPMQPKNKALLNILIAILVVLWLLNGFGYVGPHWYRFH